MLPANSNDILNNKSKRDGEHRTLENPEKG